LNQALLYSRDKLLQEAVPTIDEHRFSAPRPNSARAAATMTEFHEIPLHSVSANGIERTEAARKKWPVIAGASAALVVILAAMIPIFNRDRAASVKPAAAPAPTVTTVHQPEDAAPTRVHSKLKVPASTAAAATPREAKISSEAARPPVQTNAGPSLEQARMMNDQLHTPTRLQSKATLADQAPLPAGGFAAADIDGSDNTKAIGAVFGSPKPPEVQIASRHVIKVTSGVALGLLIRKTQPVYPPIARTARVSGRIVLAVTISKTGNVETLIVESGPPMLRTAALDAVRTWRFKPYMLDNQPTPIETTISLYFSLN
jgi:TonB family protein